MLHIGESRHTHNQWPQEIVAQRKRKTGNQIITPWGYDGVLRSISQKNITLVLAMQNMGRACVCMAVCTWWVRMWWRLVEEEGESKNMPDRRNSIVTPPVRQWTLYTAWSRMNWTIERRNEPGEVNSSQITKNFISNHVKEFGFYHKGNPLPNSTMSMVFITNQLWQWTSEAFSTQLSR